MNDFNDIVKKRYSCRSYKTDPVPREHIELMLESAQLAPSACNKQPWRFKVVTSEQHRTQLVKEGFLPGINMDWALDAPVLIVIGLQRSLVTHHIAPKISGVDYPLIDIGIAGEHLVLQAAELGLGTCWIGWIKSDKVRKIVDWPKEIEPQVIISIGWPKDENRERPTKDVSEITEWLE